MYGVKDFYELNVLATSLLWLTKTAYGSECIFWLIVGEKAHCSGEGVAPGV